MEKDYLLNKWLNEGLSASEMKEFQQREDYDELVAIVEHARQFKASQFSEVDDFNSFAGHFKEKRSSQVKKLNWVRPFLRIAAVLAVGVAIFYFLSRDTSIHIETIAAEKRLVELPDASTVLVNAESEIRYNAKSWKDNRTVELKGEAFFDVAKGTQFDVSTPSGTITVLGTEFNVKQRPNFFEVQCFEGSVQVSTDSETEILKEGDNYRLTNGQSTTGRNIFSKPQWTENKSNFQRVVLHQVVAELERQYDITIILRDVQPNTLFTGGFVHDDLENALRSVTEPMDLRYVFESTNQVSLYPREQ